MNDNQETVTASFIIPSRIYLHGRRPVGETKEIVAEHLRNQAAAICDLLAYGASLVQNQTFDEQIFVNSCGVLAKIASEHIEAIEIVERDKSGEIARASLEAQKTPETSEETFTEHLVKRMADRLATVLENPDVPETAKDALFAIADNAIENGHYCESRVEVIRNRFTENLLSFTKWRTIATLDSLTAIVENCIPDEIYSPIHKANMEKFNEK